MKGDSEKAGKKIEFEREREKQGQKEPGNMNENR